MMEKKIKIRSKKAIKNHYLPIEERKKTFKEVNLGYLNSEEVIAECERCYNCYQNKDPELKPPPCMEYCPTHCNSREIIKNFLEGNVDEALRIVYAHYPFPKSVERICPGFCMQHCTAGKKGDPIQIPTIKRYIVDHNKLPEDFYKCEPDTGKKVAIIGSGPLGLTAAYFLRKKGHDITVFEKLDTVGGMMSVGIPEFRLPKEILSEELDNIKRLGVKFVLNKGLNDEFNIDTLFKDGFNAILLCIGTHKPKWMKIPGEETEIVLHAIEFLRDFNLKKDIPDLRGKKVIVIGGGNSATDAARVAKRLGAEVSIVYRRQKEQMPAGEVEIRETEEEDITINFLTNPVEFVCKENEFQGSVCQKMMLGEPDKSGRPRPIPIQNSEFKIEANYLIEAISQEPDLNGFDTNKFKISRWNTFEVDDKYMTSVPGVFAGGDCVTGSKTVVEAIAQGKIIAKNIQDYLNSQT
ncbi:MAG: FAD-dependent oxidoreductase [Candidatus Helarchaeota archaeon]